MKSFWTPITVLIASFALILPIINTYINYIFNIEGLGIANSITLSALFITILSTLYSNHKSDIRIEKQIIQNEVNLTNQLIFNKKQEICFEFYTKLNNYWKYIDRERIEFLKKTIEYDPYISPNASEMRGLSRLIYSYHFSAEFYYLPPSIQEIINDYTIFKDTNPSFDNIKKDSTNEILAYLEAFSKLYDIFPKLRKELGKSL